MDPSTASTVFRELLQTPDNEMTMFARRAGLRASFTAEDLLKARELLEALAEALGTGANRDWEAVRAAFAGLRSKRNPYLLGSSAAAVAYSASAASSAGEPQPPALVNRVVVAKPTLGDPAPGTAQHAEHAKGRFVPSAKGRPPGAESFQDAPPGPGPMGGPPVPYVPTPGLAGAGGGVPAQAPPWPAQPAPPAAVGGAAHPSPAGSPWQSADTPEQPAAAAQASPWATDGSAGGPGWAPGRGVGAPSTSAEDPWHKPLPAMPEALAPVGASSREVAAGGPFTRADHAPVEQAQAPAYGEGTGAPMAPPPAGAAPGGTVPGASARPPAKPPPPPRRPPPPPATAAVAAPNAAQLAEAGAPGGSVYESVARYAAFCAACAEFPDRLEQTLAGYGLGSEAERARVDSLWQDRFDDDADLLGRWEQLFAGFRKSLR